MALSSKVLVFLVVISLVSMPGQCQRFRTNSSSSRTSTSPVVTILSAIGGILCFIAVCIGCGVFCYRLSLNNQRERPYTRPSRQARTVYSSYSSATTQQQAPTVVHNASYSQYHDSAGTGGQQQQSRVLYDINHTAKQESTSMHLPQATLQEGVEPPTYEEASNIETPPTQQKTVEPDNQPPPYTLDSADTTN